jgi:hypothetical protein
MGDRDWEWEYSTQPLPPNSRHLDLIFIKTAAMTSVSASGE